MLFQSIKKTLDFPKSSPIVRQGYVDFLAKTFSLSHNGHHGFEHWMRVLINGRLLAEKNGADIEVVEHFRLSMMLCAKMKTWIYITDRVQPNL